MALLATTPLAERPTIEAGRARRTPSPRHRSSSSGAASRPLPSPWLTYAALDVEVLLDLRDLLERELVDTGKIEWAEQEFAAIAAAPPPPPRIDPWRRTSGMHKIRSRRQMAAVRALWQSRDELARIVTLENGKTIRESRAEVDSALVEGRYHLTQVSAFYGHTGPGAFRDITTWVQYQPLGVVGVISPWNFPMNVMCRKTLPALLTGNTVVFKPASFTPWSGVFMAGLFGAFAYEFVHSQADSRRQAESSFRVQARITSELTSSLFQSSASSGATAGWRLKCWNVTCGSNIGSR